MTGWKIETTKFLRKGGQSQKLCSFIFSALPWRRTISFDCLIEAINYHASSENQFLFDERVRDRIRNLRDLKGNPPPQVLSSATVTNKNVQLSSRNKVKTTDVKSLTTKCNIFRFRMYMNVWRLHPYFYSFVSPSPSLFPFQFFLSL